MRKILYGYREATPNVAPSKSCQSQGKNCLQPLMKEDAADCLSQAFPLVISANELPSCYPGTRMTLASQSNGFCLFVMREFSLVQAVGRYSTFRKERL